MADEFTHVIAAALVAKGAEAAIAGGRTALAALARLVRGRSGANDRTAIALDRAIAAPDDRRGQVELADALAAAMAADPRFAAQVLAQWRAVCAEDAASRGTVVNHVSGTVHKVIQARDVHGSISL